MTLLRRILGTFRRPDAPPSAPARDDVEAALALINEGNEAEDSGNLPLAREKYLAAVAAAPRFAKAHVNLGNAYLAENEVDRAMEAYGQAITHDPTLAAAHYNLANCHWHADRVDAALQSYQHAAKLKPEFDLPWVGMANALGRLGRTEEAIDACARALQINENCAEAHFVLSMLHQGKGQLEEAERHLRDALRLNDRNAAALSNLGHLRWQLLDHAEAKRCFTSALAADPNVITYHTNSLFYLSHDPETSSKELYEAHRASGTELEKRQDRTRAPSPHATGKSDRLRVGFVSADFHSHAVANFFLPIIRGLRQERDISFYGYYNSAHEDQTTGKIRECFDHWRNISSMSDADAQSLIVEDGIGILVDLSGYTHGNRLTLFARKPAPVQASWIGYPGTTGMDAMDYYISDRYFLPHDVFADSFTEKLVHIPANSLFSSYDESPPVNNLPASEGHPFTFASFNRPNKLNRSCIARWSKLLNATPGSRILVAGISHPAQESIIGGWFEEDGVDPSRVTFRSRTNVDGYMRLHHEVDLCLDTFPYSGGTTTNHALWMGVPTLTMIGSTPASRQTACVLRHLDLPLFVARDPEEFVNLGKYWSQNTAELAAIRAQLRERIESSPIRRTELICSSLSEALRIMWRRSRDHEPAAYIDVSGWNRAGG